MNAADFIANISAYAWSYVQCCHIKTLRVTMASLYHKEDTSSAMQSILVPSSTRAYWFRALRWVCQLLILLPHALVGLIKATSAKPIKTMFRQSTDTPLTHNI